MLRNLRGFLLLALSAYVIITGVGYVGDRFPSLGIRGSGRHPTSGTAHFAGGGGIVWKSLEDMAQGEHRIRSSGGTDHVDDVAEFVACTAGRGAEVTVIASTAKSREVIVRSDAGEDCRGWVTAERVVP